MYQQGWYDLMLPPDLQRKLEIKTIGELCEMGCSICHQPLFAEGSGGFGSLYCLDHGIAWMFGLNAIQDRYPSMEKGRASRVWKSFLTNEISKKWESKYGKAV